MDNSGAFVAADIIDPVQRRVPGKDRTGRNGLPVAQDEMDGDSYIGHGEQSPLLPSDSGSGSGDEGSEGEARRRFDSSTKPIWATEYEDSLPWYRTPSVYWLLGPFVLSALAFGGIIIPKVNLILGLICREYYADRSINPSGSPIRIFDLNEVDPQCRLPAVQAKVANFTTVGGLISGLLSAVIAPRLGALSDRYGRRRIMLITNFGGLSNEIITIFAATFPRTFPVHWIWLGFIFDGLCGGFIASMAISNSYATDCTAPNKRNIVFGYFHGCMFAGIALGPMIAALVIKSTGSVISMFYIALGCHLLFIMLLIFVIPESLSKARQHAARDKYRQEKEEREGATGFVSGIRLINLFEPLKVLYPKGPGTNAALRRNLLLLASVDGIIFGVGSGAIMSIVLYSNYKFEWSAYTQSIFISIVSTLRVAGLVFILPAITWAFRGKDASGSTRSGPQTGTDLFEVSVIRLAIFFDILGFLGYALARTGPLFIASGAVASLGGIGSPTLQAALTKHVSPDQVGQLLGAMGLLHSFARVFAPTFFNTVYAYTVGKFDQAVFVILTVLFTCAWIVSWLVKPGVHMDPIEELEQPDGRKRQASVRMRLGSQLGI